MTFIPKVEIQKPSRSNQNLSRRWRSTIAPGLLYPVLVQDCYAGDHMSWSSRELLKSLPLNGPLMSSFKLQIDAYFIYARNYIASLHNNPNDFDPYTTYFPLYPLIQYDLLENLPTSIAEAPYVGVSPSSVYHYLGIPERFVEVEATEAIRWFNAIPLIGYYDIFKTYYANTQERLFYAVGYQGGDPEPRLVPFALSNLDRFREALLAAPSGAPVNVQSLTPNISHPMRDIESYSHSHLGGLVCRTHLPDRFTAWVNREKYQAIDSSTIVPVGSEGFTIDQFRLQEKMNRMLQKTLVAGGRFSDWEYVQYGTTARPMTEVPTFIGSHSLDLNFEDVVQTSDAGANDDPLGTLGGRGLAYSGDRSFNYFCQTHGYIMCIASLVPRVDYYQGVKHYNRFRTMGDIHVPELDAVGFQDLLTDDFYAEQTSANTITDPGTYLAVAKQPAWIELMTAVDDVHGEFAEENKLMYLTLVRRYHGSFRENNSNNNFTTYINPSDYNYAFADASLTSQNFWLQIRWSFRAKRALSKKVMPSL